MDDDWTRERYDFLKCNISALSGDDMSLRKWINQDIDREMPKSDVVLGVADGYRPAAPKGYAAPNYRGYYPVLGAQNVTIRQVSDRQALNDINPGGTMVNSSGYALRRNVSNGALVITGGDDFADKSNAKLTLYGGEHEIYGGYFSIVAGGDTQKQLMGRGDTLTWSGKYVAGDGFADVSMPCYTGAVNLKYVFTYDQEGSGDIDDFSGDEAPAFDSAELASHVNGVRVDGETVEYVDDMKNNAYNLGARVRTDNNGHKIYYFRAPYAGWFVFFNSLPAGTTVTAVVLHSETAPAVIYAQCVNGLGGQKQVGLTVPCQTGSIIKTWISGGTMGTSEIPNGYDVMLKNNVYQYSGVCRFVRTCSTCADEMRPLAGTGQRSLRKGTPEPQPNSTSRSDGTPPIVDTKPSIGGGTIEQLARSII